MPTRARHLTLFVLAILLAARPSPARASSRHALDQSGAQDQVCDPLADYFLGMEDYPEALRRHLEVIREHPGNALAHYHLGFIYGLMGDREREQQEYQKAIDLGLSDWALFLNLGLLDLDSGRSVAATDVLRLATLLGPDHPETHFNLGLAYEHRGMLRAAEREMLYSLELDPGQLDTRNALGVIYAEEGDYPRAGEEWSEIEQSDPGYSPAQQNLVILQHVEHGGPAGAAHGFARVR